MVKYFIFSLIFLIIPFFSYACTTELECLQDIKSQNTSISEYIGVTSEPVGLLDIEEFNQNMSDSLKVFGVFMGLSLFASSFAFASYFIKR